MKVVINTCYGGFGLSKEALTLYARLKCISERDLYPMDIPRDDPILIRVVEQLAENADDRFSELRIVEIPDDVQWHISEYDGIEHVAEDHRTWL